MATPQQTPLPDPSRLGRVLGYVLLAASVACLPNFVFTALAPVRIERWLLWFGLGFALLTCAPGLLFALSPRLLGGPIAWYLRVYAATVRRGSRGAGLMFAWMGLCMSAIGWIFALVPPLLASRTSVGAVVLAAWALLLAPLLLRRSPRTTR